MFDDQKWTSLRQTAERLKVNDPAGIFNRVLDLIDERAQFVLMLGRLQLLLAWYSDESSICSLSPEAIAGVLGLSMDELNKYVGDAITTGESFFRSQRELS